MKILITGANGFIGRYLVDILSKKDIIYALVRNKKNLNFKINKNIKIIEVDLYDFDVSTLPKNIEMIYYLAQSRKFREFPTGADDIFEINVHAPLKLAQWSVENKVKKFVYVSTGGIYTSKDNKPLKEYILINANEKINFYLSSKLSAEILLRNYSKYFETFVIVRPFFVYGVGQNKTMLIPRLIENIKKGEKIILNGKDGIKINPIYVTDAVKALSEIKNLKGEHIINIAGKEVISLKKLCILIGKFLNKNPIFEYSKEKQDDLIADITEMESKLCKPKVNIKEGLKKTIKSLL